MTDCAMHHHFVLSSAIFLHHFLLKIANERIRYEGQANKRDSCEGREMSHSPQLESEEETHCSPIEDLGGEQTTDTTPSGIKRKKVIERQRHPVGEALPTGEE